MPTYNNDHKYDIQLSQSEIDEHRLGEIFTARRIEKVELKTERHQWEETRRICIEYKRAGKPSGISTTEADYWVHELARGDETLLYLMFPIDRLKELVKLAHKRGSWRKGAGDGALQHVVLLRIKDLLA